jgi:hypothetical protein
MPSPIPRSLCPPGVAAGGVSCGSPARLARRLVQALRLGREIALRDTAAPAPVPAVTLAAGLASADSPGLAAPRARMVARAPRRPARAAVARPQRGTPGRPGRGGASHPAGAGTPPARTGTPPNLGKVRLTARPVPATSFRTAPTGAPRSFP